MKNYIILICLALFNNSIFSQEGVSAFDGEYQIRPGFNIVISSEGEDLYVTPTDKPAEKLTTVSDNIFKVESINGTIDFTLNAESGYNFAIVKMYGQTIHAPKLPFSEKEENWVEIELDEAELKSFEGKYQLAPSAKFSVSIEEGILFVQLTGQQKFEVYPFADNRFFYKVVKASIEFIKGENGEIEYLLLHQGGIILQADKI